MLRCASCSTGTVNGHRPENVVLLRGGGPQFFIKIQMKITPEISFTLEFTEEEATLLSNKFIAVAAPFKFDVWKASFEMFEKLLDDTVAAEPTITLTLKEAKELMEDIADAGLSDEFKELWSALWNAIKGY